jgi:hypothetical protein
VGLVCALASGCGSLGGEDVGPNPADKQRATLECLDEKGVDAGPTGRHDIQVGEPPDGPLVRFYLTSGEAEAAQFKGRAEGAEHIGSALLYARGGSDELLEDVENCLADL